MAKPSIHALTIIFGLLGLLWPSGLGAEDMRRLTLIDGLAGLSVKSIVEDPSGEMWIGTSNGITLYNGMTCRNYELPRQSDGMTSFCHELTLDSLGNVWAATRNGVFRLRRGMDRFEQVAGELTFAECILCMGSTIYVGSRTGLYAIDQKDHLRQVDISAGLLRENTSVRCLRRQGHYLWLTLRTGLLRIDTRTGRRQFLSLDTPSGLSRFDVCRGRLVVGTKNNGLYVVDPKNGESRRLEWATNVINNVHTNPDGTIAVATDGDGAYIVDPQTMAPLQHLTSENTNGQMLSNAVYCFMRRKDGTLWMGMFQSGLAYTCPNYNLFRPYALGTFSTQGMRVTATLRHGHERLIAVKGGVWIVDERSGSYQFVDTSPMKMFHIMTIRHFADSYYIGSFDSGLLRMDAHTHRLSRLPDMPQLEYASVSTMAIAPNQQQLWVGSSEGIFVIDRSGRVVHNYTEKNSKLPTNVTSIWFDPKGTAWIGCAYKLCLYLPAEHDFKVTDFPSGFFNNQPQLKLTGRGDTIVAWSSTNIYQTNTTMTRFGQMAIPEGVLSERCFDLVLDSGNVLWVVTEKGLFRLDGSNQPPLYFTTSSGLTGIINATGTLGVDNDHVWVGTTDGLMVADRQMFSKKMLNSRATPFLLSTVLIGQHTLRHGEMQTANDNRELRVGWNLLSQRLDLMPVLMDFYPHHGAICTFSIDNGHWRQHTLGRMLTIDRLSPGRHTLRLTMAGMERTSTEYTIYVYPSVWFYIEVVLLLVAAALFWWWRAWRRRTKVLLSEHRETESALLQEISQMTQTGMAEQGQEKYQKNRSSNRELAQLYRRMDDYVKAERPYLNPELKMSDIATALGVSPTQLSQVFTLHLKEPYYDYINKYRLEEFKQLIAEGKHHQYTIMALFEQCGFKKTTFASSFKKFEGMTPTEYIQKKSL